MSLAKFSSYFNNPIADLEDEIRRLEIEIIRLESHLLELYRTALEDRRFSPIISPTNATKVTRRSLADHLGDKTLDSNRLSEDILRCVASIYCKFGSKSSLFYDMIGVSNIELNDERAFSDALASLERLRYLVRSLEKVDPKKMKRDEKIAFWTNIHNALLMHAYLAYGTGNRASAFKAVYNIGGHGINAQIIQTSILRIRTQNSAPWLQTLFPGKMAKHEYALECPEPLVHFGLSSGDRSNPPVRLYTAKRIIGELKVAKEEFIKARAEILQDNKETKVLLPRILYFYAKDASVDMKSGLVQWLPQTHKFGYLIHPQLAYNIDS